jgi:hypothetical protein
MVGIHNMTTEHTANYSRPRALMYGFGASCERAMGKYREGDML